MRTKRERERRKSGKLQRNTNMNGKEKIHKTGRSKKKIKEKRVEEKKSE